VFGPVGAVFKVKHDTAAIAKANETNFGLGASIWTENRDRGRQIARQIKAGCTYINQLVKSDPRVPFGGVKDSGYGRELAGPGIMEFVNRKTLWVE
jgi:succinate-semialdehyde dehydrogenase/glutarate-semialdehyde dehydrogenase